MRRTIENFLPLIWMRRGQFAWLLLPISWCYLFLLALRRVLYRWGFLVAHSAPVPVIVVGNVIAGGAGKTPVVMALVQHLQSRGLHPGVISRGHGRTTHDCREVQEHSQAADVGDEAQLIQRRCRVPVFVASRRIEAAQALVASYPQTDVLLCDDGLQHLALKRDIDICVFDDRGIGNGWILPAGPLREAWPRPVDLVLHTGATKAFAGFKARRELAPQALRQDGSTVALSSLRGKSLVALAGIANPQNFFALLRAAGLELAQTIALPDHFSFDGWRVSLQPDTILLCTEKDAAKLWRSHPAALAVPLALELEGTFLSALESMLPASLKAKLSSPEPFTREPPHGQQTS